VQGGREDRRLRYWSMSQCQLGDTYNVFVDNVWRAARRLSESKGR
jgi:hypothetical protein